MSKLDKKVQIEIDDYIVTFNHTTLKTSVRRKDGKKIDQKSDKFKKDLLKIKTTKEYITNQNLMRIKGGNRNIAVSEKEKADLLRFTKQLLHEDSK